MATIRNVSFPKAYCIQLKKILNIYEVRENYFDEDCEHLGIKYEYTCPDINCNAKMGPVNAYSSKKVKQALHFRKHPTSEHQNCSYINVLDNPLISELDAEVQIRNKLEFNIPTHFLLIRPPQKGIKDTEAGSSIISDDVESHNENKNKGHNNNNHQTNKHETNQLERIVDVYTNPIYNSNYIRKNNLRLTLPDGISRYFDNCFQQVRWFKKHTAPFIFYDLIDEIKTYGRGYKIYLKTQISDNVGEKNVKRRISIYIPQTLIEQYRFRKQFIGNINEIMNNDLNSSTKIYFTGAYPKLVSIPGTEYFTYTIELENLSYLLLTHD